MKDADLDCDLALLAKWRKDDWWLPGWSDPDGNIAPPPPFSASIDSQQRWLDPIVEAKYKSMFEEGISQYSAYHGPAPRFRCSIHMLTDDRFFVGDGPTRAEARARALKAALEKTP